MLPDGYSIRELEVSDGPALADAYRRNRAHLEPWDPAEDAAFFTDRGQAQAVRSQLKQVADRQLVAWLIVAGDQVVGRVNLNNIVLGALRGASLGYWVDAQHLRRGLAVAAVESACAQARGRGLHRVMAGTMLDNTASQRVLVSCGFEEYGLAPKYLFIRGAWQDHRLYQRILHDDPPP